MGAVTPPVPLRRRRAGRGRPADPAGHAPARRRPTSCCIPGTYLDPEILENCSPTAELIDTQHLDLDAIVARIVDAHALRSTGRAAGVGRPLALQRGVRADPPARRRRRAVGGHARRAGLRRRGRPRRPRVDRAAGRAVGGADADPARSTAMPETESLAAFAATGATLVLHLAITRTRELMADSRRLRRRTVRSWWCTGPPSPTSCSFAALSPTSPTTSRRPVCGRRR